MTCSAMKLVQRCFPRSKHKPSVPIGGTRSVSFPCWLQLHQDNARPVFSPSCSLRHSRLHRSIMDKFSLLALAPIAHEPSTSPSVWLTLSIITGLPIILWAYKCFMLIVFQRKIIYMGYVPPGSRKESIKYDVPAQWLKNVHCESIKATTPTKTKLSGILVQSGISSSSHQSPRVVLLYLQGNAGNPLHRLPVFQTLLQKPRIPSTCGLSPEYISIVAFAPRSYWSSSNLRPTQNGILSDYKHALKWTLKNFPNSRVVLYGHSLGGAAAVCLLAQLEDGPEYQNVLGLILENPFASIPGMVRALYPERWLPYKYLASLAYDKWDAIAAAAQHSMESTTVLGRLSRDALVLVSEKDEVVPPEMGHTLFQALHVREGDGIGDKVVIKNALHENAWTVPKWAHEMLAYLAKISRLMT